MILRNATATNDRDGIEDAVYRFVEGIDKRDAALLASAFTEDIIFDLGGLDASVGRFQPYEGRDYAVELLMNHVGKPDSMHAVTNIRVEIDGDQAHLTCYLIGQHHRPGEGASADHGDHLWLGNFFDTHLVRDHDHVWRIRRHRVDSSWANGNVAATHLPS
jgi:SnoaL-like domain